MKSQAIQVTFDNKLPDHQAADRLYYESTVWSKVDKVVSVMLFVFGIIVVWAAGFRWWTLIWFPPAVFEWFNLLSFRRLQVRFFFKRNPKFRETYHLTFTEDGIHFRTESVDSIVHWNHYDRVIYFIRLPANAVLNRLIEPYLTRPVGRPPKSGIQIRLVDLRYRAQTWDKERRVVARIEWHDGELFPRIGFIVTNSKLPAGKVVKVYNGRCDVENRIKEGKNTLRWDKTSCRRFAANQARLLMGVLAYNLLHMLRQFYLLGEEVKRSMEWLIKRLIKVGAKVAYHGRRWQVHVASAFPLAHHYRAAFG